MSEKKTYQIGFWVNTQYYVPVECDSELIERWRSGDPDADEELKNLVEANFRGSDHWCDQEELEPEDFDVREDDEDDETEAA